MNRIIFYFIVILAITLCSCKDDTPDVNHSIFDTSTPALNSFDEWLRQNYVAPYNIRVYYRLRDIETDFDYNVIPADIEKAKQMAWLLKYLWLEAYAEVAADGMHFVRANVPRILHFIGSAEWDESTKRLGVAEGGLKITITEVNDLIPKQITEQYFFSTIHHEFGHILIQTKDFPAEFKAISAGSYMPAQWYNRSETDAARAGFVTQYAGAQPGEDFVEVLSRYITWSETQWENKLTQAGTFGRTVILLKLGMVKEYMKNRWDVNIDELRSVIKRRANDIQSMDFDNLGF